LVSGRHLDLSQHCVSMLTKTILGAAPIA